MEGNVYNYVKLKKADLIITQCSGDYEKTYEVIPPGVYSIGQIMSMAGKVLALEPTKTPDSLIKFKHGMLDSFITKVRKFFSDATIKKYKDFKLGHKLGIVLYGPPGTGKTSTAFMIMEELVKDFDAIALVCTGRQLNFITGAIKQIRTLQSNPIVIFVDEFDSSVEDEEEQYLTFLDGEDSFEKLIFIGCTNDLGSLPERIVYRPSRIKYLYEIDKFPCEVYEQYVMTKIPLLSKEIASEIAFKASENSLTIDQLKHVLIDYAIEDLKIDDAIALVKKHSKTIEVGEKL